MGENSHIVADGRERVNIDVRLIAKLRAEVECELDQEIREAKTGWQRWRLHWKTEREIKRRLGERHIGSDKALYFRNEQSLR